MCVVSNISDYGKQHVWPNPDDWKWKLPLAPGPYTPEPFFPHQTIPVKVEPNPFSKEEVERIREFLKLLEMAKKVDEMTGQADCPDPEKAAWVKKLAERLDGIESKLKQKEK